MKLFYSNIVKDDIISLPQEEAIHCFRVLRHKIGDQINVIDGRGNLYLCEILDSKSGSARIISKQENFGSHPYNIHLAVAPTKNTDRFEWFLEKATEIGIDRITPVVCEHSERKVLKTIRGQKIILSAVKQSLKAYLPHYDDTVSFKEFINKINTNDNNAEVLKYIAFCDEELISKEGFERISISEAVKHISSKNKPCIFLIGPEGDFSSQEALTAMKSGFIPITLGSSRLRTETAALFIVAAVNLCNQE